jgi:hypothetical protein
VDCGTQLIQATPEFQLDRIALDVICSAVPPEKVTMLDVKDTIMEAWKASRQCHSIALEKQVPRS